MRASSLIKKIDVCNFKKMSRERIYHHYGFNLFEKIKVALNYSHNCFNEFETH